VLGGELAHQRRDVRALGGGWLDVRHDRGRGGLRGRGVGRRRGRCRGRLGGRRRGGGLGRWRRHRLRLGGLLRLGRRVGLLPVALGLPPLGRGGVARLGHLAVRRAVLGLLVLRLRRGGRLVGRGRLGVLLLRRRGLGHRVGIAARFGPAGRGAARFGAAGRGSRRRLGRLGLPVGCRSGGVRGVVDDRELGADGDRLVLRDRDPAQDARRRGGDLGVHLVGGDLEQRLVRLYALAFLLEPARDGALGDALAELGHGYRDRHGLS